MRKNPKQNQGCKPQNLHPLLQKPSHIIKMYKGSKGELGIDPWSLSGRFLSSEPLRFLRDSRDSVTPGDAENKGIEGDQPSVVLVTPKLWLQSLYRSFKSWTQWRNPFGGLFQSRGVWDSKLKPRTGKPMALPASDGQVRITWGSGVSP